MAPAAGGAGVGLLLLTLIGIPLWRPRRGWRVASLRQATLDAAD
jgi:hypothetical protein